jgi:hypothetical protein
MDVDNVALLVIPAYCLWQIRNANMAHKLISTLKLAYMVHQMTSLARRPWELKYSEQHHVQPRLPHVHLAACLLPYSEVHDEARPFSTGLSLKLCPKDPECGASQELESRCLG